MKKFIAALTLLVVTGFAVSAQQSSFQEVGMCPPPPITQDFIKKMVRVEIKGTLTYIPATEGPPDPMFPIPYIACPEFTTISVKGKMYQLDLNGAKDLLLAKSLNGKRVIVTGILNGTNVRVADMKADEESVKETIEFQSSGQNDIMTCMPPTIRIEINGNLTYFAGRSRHRPDLPRAAIIAFPGISQVSANGKTYQLDFSGSKDLLLLAGKLNGQRVIVIGILHGNIVHVTELRADGEYVKETTEVEARGRIQTIRVPNNNLLDIYIEAPIIAVEFVVDGKTYNLELTPELWKLAVSLEGKDVLVTGILNNGTITVKSLNAAMVLEIDNFDRIQVVK